MKYSKGYKNRVNRYPKKCTWKNQSLTMHHWNLKIKISELQKISKKLYPKWIDFWNLISDSYHLTLPEYCFICGYYIPISQRENYAKRPFKNGDLVHESCWKNKMSIKEVYHKLTPDTMLICFLDRPFMFDKIQVKPLCRLRIKNDEEEIRKHIKQHNENLTYTHRDWKQIRADHFLKPNGKAFPRPRD